MRPLLFLAALCAAPLLSFSAPPDDAGIAKQLEALGGQVSQKDGVVTQVTFKDCARIGEEELRAIGRLEHLKSLTLFGKVHGLNDATASTLTGLKELETLATEGAQLSDAGLRQLSSLTSLRSAAFFHLSPGMEGFTGIGFATWTTMPNLESLTVAGTSVNDEGLAAIATLTSLLEFRTWHTWQTEAGNAQIAKLPNLTKLDLGQRLPRGGTHPPSVTDATLTTVAGIKTLEALKIGETHFTLEALRGLKALPRLKHLTIFECDISASDIDSLRADLPGVQIEFQPLTDEQRKKFETYLKE